MVLSLRKPNQYPLARPETEKQEQTIGKLFSVSEDVTVHGRSLKLSGYIYLQYNRAVEPMEIRGLLVRIRNIAIGVYDPLFLSIRVFHHHVSTGYLVKFTLTPDWNLR